MDINNVTNKKNLDVLGAKSTNKQSNAPHYENNSEKITGELNKMSELNKTVFRGNTQKYELNMSMEELEKRTSKDYLLTKKMLTADAPEYRQLDNMDKLALKHLVKASAILEKINMQLDNKHNLEFKSYLDSEISKGNKQAELTKILFDAQKGICAIDTESNLIELAKGIKECPGKGFYPEDLSKEEFHQILIKMLNNGKIEEVKNILNQRSVVQRNGDELISIDYIDLFKEDFAQMALEIEKAAMMSTNGDFKEYLLLQSKALKEANPMLDAYADKKWAELQDTPLEFTITRENYSDEMTESVVENSELKSLLDKYEITPVCKDSLGCRVGIVNKKGTDDILKVKDYLKIMADNMPYKNEYEQNINPTGETKQTMVDVDLVAVAGDVGEYRGGITLAENLPNDDKLSIQVLDGGRRNVYHRQIRMVTSDDGKKKLQQRLDAILDKKQHSYYDHNADHLFTIGHENGHSLGPKSGTDALGKYKSIIEENKADMVSLAMLDVLTEKGMYTKEQRDSIIVSYAADNMLKSKPQMSQPHRVRSVMQNYYFLKKGAIEISPEGVLKVNIEKMVPTAKEMLAEIVRIQIDGDFSKGEKYVLDNFQWTPEMEKVAEKIRTVSKTLNGKVESELADKLLLEP